MNKLLTTFTTASTLANAVKVVKYGNKHPMATCFLTAEELAVYNQAKKMVAV